MMETATKLCRYCGTLIEPIEICCARCLLYEAWEEWSNLSYCPYCREELIGNFEVCCDRCLREGRPIKVNSKEAKKMGAKLGSSKIGYLFFYFCVFFFMSMMLMALLWMASCTLKQLQG